MYLINLEINFGAEVKIYLPINLVISFGAEIKIYVPINLEISFGANIQIIKIYVPINLEISFGANIQIIKIYFPMNTIVLCEDLITTVRKRKLRWHGHIIRSTGLAKMILEDTAQGGIRKGRQKKR